MAGKQRVNRVLMTLLLIGLWTVALNIRQARAAPITWTVDDDGPADFHTIQEAINAAAPLGGEASIFVHAGTYEENLRIDGYLGYFRLHLLGENRYRTIVNGSIRGVVADGSSIANFTVTGFLDFWASIGTTVANATVYGGLWYGFESGMQTITHNTIYNGLHLSGDSWSVITNNVVYGGIVAGWGYKSLPYEIDIRGNTLIGGLEFLPFWRFLPLGVAIYLMPGASGLTIVKNTIINASIGIYEEHGVSYFGITATGRNIISENYIAFCDKGIYFSSPYETATEYEYYERFSGYSKVSRNTLYRNNYGVYLKWIDRIEIFHNNFIDNSIQLLADLHPSYNTKNSYDQGYPSGGNYWSDYTGVDLRSGSYQNMTGSDGIGDTPYFFDENNRDNYPLMELWSIHELKTKIEEFRLEGEINNQRLVRSLITKLDAVQKLVDRGKFYEAKTILLDDFIPQIQNLSGIQITREAADILIKSSEYVIRDLLLLNLEVN